jgi:hypothetical protein
MAVYALMTPVVERSLGGVDDICSIWYDTALVLNATK